jgi:divalent metal cation (Fe/Co/Zn/Cd) transporter
VLIAAIIMLFVTSAATVYMGINKIINPKPISTIWIAYIVLIFFILTNGYALSLAIKRLKKEKEYTNFIKSIADSAMIETKTTLILDLAGTLSAAVGLINLIAYGITGNLIFDGLGAVMIGIMLAILTIFLLISVSDLLIGNKASDLTERNIRKAALSVINVEKVIALKTMNIGVDQLLVNIDIHVKHDLTTTQIENITKKVKAKIIKENPQVTHVNVEIGKMRSSRS